MSDLPNILVEAKEKNGLEECEEVDVQQTKQIDELQAKLHELRG